MAGESWGARWQDEGAVRMKAGGTFPAQYLPVRASQGPGNRGGLLDNPKYPQTQARVMQTTSWLCL